MPTRKHHTKTRRGCNTCKHRKVRCDEEKPVCRNCTRGNRACSYASDQGQAFPGAFSTNDAGFPVRDMSLLHYYTTTTYRIMTPEAVPLHVWQNDVPIMAFEHRFLLHGLLAMTALHKRSSADDSQRTALMDLARYHQQHALTLYIPMLRSIDDQNCHPLFAFSVVLSTTIFAMLEDHQAPQALIRNFLDTIDTLMGCTAIAVEAKDWLPRGPLQHFLLDVSVLSNSPTVLEENSKEALEALLKLIDRVCTESEPATSPETAATRRQAYDTAIRCLPPVLAPPPGRHQLSVVVSWPVMAGYEYVSLLKNGDQLAMVILAHYGVALHIYGNDWMCAGLGKRLTEAIASNIDPSWLPHLAWAESRVKHPSSKPPIPI